MKTQTRKLRLVVLAGILIVGASCSTSSDPTLQYLSALAAGATPTAPTSSDPVPFTVTADNVIGDPAFMFDTTRTIPVFVSVQNPVSPIAGSLVQVLDETTGSTASVMFQAVTSADGTIRGQFTVNQTLKQVTIVVTLNGGQALRVVVSIVSIMQIQEFFFVDLRLVTSVVVSDRDGDGIPDDQDAYPDDASRSALVRIPSESNYSVAFEDLYPVQGDADFNDYVVRLYNEEDLNAQGLVTRVRGSYTHIACGAGYKHNLRLSLPNAEGTYAINVYKADGTLSSMTTGSLTAGGSIDVFNGLTSWDTLGSMANSKVGQVFKPGMSAQIEVVFAQPVPRSSLTSAPYDLFVHVINTNKDIHFLGRYFNADGTDKYLDPNGFPWALLVPGNWKWPYEKQNIHQSYQFFFDWYKTGGLTSPDWYNFPNLDLVYPTP